MKKIYGVRSNTVLVSVIFLLWSLGIVFIPDFRSHAPSSVFLGLIAVYLFLHAAIFIFALSLLKQSVSHFSRKNRAQKNTSLWYAILYGYVLLSLAVSAYLIARTPYF